MNGFGLDDLAGTIVGRFERIVARSPDSIAVIAESGSWTYAELDRKANGIAHWLQEACPGRQSAIALYMGMGALQIASLLGVLKSGHIYVPLELEFPDERNAHAASQSGATLILVDECHLGLPASLSHLRSMSVDQAPKLGYFATDTSPEDVAFIIYTSGSTGVPKGVYFNHRSVLHQIMKFTDATGIQEADRLTCFYSAGVIGAMRDIYGALLNGAALWPFNPKHSGIPEMAAGLRYNRITVYNSVATLFRNFIDGLKVSDTFSDVRLVRLGGEMIYRRDVEKMARHFRPDCTFFTGFGLSETGTVAHYFASRYQDLPDRIPAGIPAPGMDVLILDDRRNVLPAGSVGEVAVRSRYLAAGYWRDPERTRERFIDDPQGSDLPVFRTGDIGYLEDGTLHVVGRADYQVKVRGFKVDLALVEATLLHCAGVGACAVVAFEDDLRNTNLAAFLVPAEGVPSVSALRRELLRSLPAHMIPSRFLFVSKLPLTANGKLDRKALQVPPLGPRKSHKSANVVEHVIAETWKDVLGTDRCGPGDDFWELGGNSLLAAGLMAELQERLSVNVPIAMLWEAPTVPELASLLRGVASPRWPAVVCFRTEASRPPLFVAPGAGSDALALYHLSQALGEDQPVCALQYRGADGVQEPHRRIEQAAADYINEIRKIQARGPYWIAGTSFGGLVAFEIARQLLQQGEQVAMLGIIDTRAPGFPIPREDLSLRQRFQVWWRPLLPQANQDSYSRENVKAGLRQILLRFWARILKRVRGSATVHRWRFLYVLDANVRMRNRYVPGQYRGAITLFRSESRPPSELFLDDPSMGWSRYCTDQIQLIDIPGTHGAHIRPPHATSLARELRRVMDSVASEVR